MGEQAGVDQAFGTNVGVVRIRAVIVKGTAEPVEIFPHGVRQQSTRFRSDFQLVQQGQALVTMLGQSLALPDFKIDIVVGSRGLAQTFARRVLPSIWVAGVMGQSLAAGTKEGRHFIWQTGRRRFGNTLVSLDPPCSHHAR